MSPNPPFQHQSWNVQGLQTVRQLCTQNSEVWNKRKNVRSEACHSSFLLQPLCASVILPADKCRGGVSDFVMKRHADCSYYLTDITKIGVLRYHNGLCDSIRLCKERKLCLWKNLEALSVCQSFSVFTVKSPYMEGRKWREQVCQFSRWNHYFAAVVVDNNIVPIQRKLPFEGLTHILCVTFRCDQTLGVGFGKRWYA